MASILSNGDIFVCPNVPRRKEFIQGNIKNNDFIEVWENKFKIFRSEERTSCNKCKECSKKREEEKRKELLLKDLPPEEGDKEEKVD